MPSMSIKKLWRRKSVDITGSEETYKVVYLGNVLTGWAKGEGCVEKPLSTLWRNYCQNNRRDISMKVTICGSGLRAVTKEHGLTEYWAHRITYCTAHPAYPRVFCWVYRHEGRKLKQELRCHAVLCSKPEKSKIMSATLEERLTLALQEFRREKIIRQNARSSVMNAIYVNPLPLRRLALVTGSTNYRPPLERSKSAPKLLPIEEMKEEEDAEEMLMAAWALRGRVLTYSPIIEISCSKLSERHRSSSNETIKCAENDYSNLEIPNNDVYILPCFNDLNINHNKDDSLSDQHDSISSGSCNSSCKDSTDDNTRNLKNQDDDNISEESGYSEAKDCLSPSELNEITVV